MKKVILGMVLFVVSCNEDRNYPEIDLIGSKFEIESTDISSETDYDLFSISFSDSSYGGNDGCNSYGGDLYVIQDSIYFQRPMTTYIYCMNINEFPCTIFYDYSPYIYKQVDSKILLTCDVNGVEKTITLKLENE